MFQSSDGFNACELHSPSHSLFSSDINIGSFVDFDDDFLTFSTASFSDKTSEKVGDNYIYIDDTSTGANTGDPSAKHKVQDVSPTIERCF